MMQNRQKLFGVEIDAVRMNEAVDRIFRWIDQPQDQCQFVVTPNVDHTVLLRENEQLRNAYRDSGMVLADGHPVVLAARFLGKPLPERVPGSDLVPRVFSAADDRTPITTFLLGAANGIADTAAENIESKWENVYVTGTYSPPIGFENDTAECEKNLGSYQSSPTGYSDRWIGSTKTRTLDTQISRSYQFPRRPLCGCDD